MHAITTAARHSTGPAAEDMLQIASTIQQEIKAGIEAQHIFNFMERVKVHIGANSDGDQMARNQGVDFLGKTITWTPGQFAPAVLKIGSEVKVICNLQNAAGSVTDFQQRAFGTIMQSLPKTGDFYLLPTPRNSRSPPRPLRWSAPRGSYTSTPCTMP